MSGIIDSSGEYVIGSIGVPYNGTASLTSTAANRKIEISVNGGLDYSTPEYDVEEPGVIGVVIKAFITDIKFTGEEGDVWMSLV